MYGPPGQSMMPDGGQANGQNSINFQHQAQLMALLNQTRNQGGGPPAHPNGQNYGASQPPQQSLNAQQQMLLQQIQSQVSSVAQGGQQPPHGPGSLMGGPESNQGSNSTAPGQGSASQQSNNVYSVSAQQNLLLGVHRHLLNVPSPTF